MFSIIKRIHHKYKKNKRKFNWLDLTNHLSIHKILRNFSSFFVFPVLLNFFISFKLKSLLKSLSRYVEIRPDPKQNSKENFVRHRNLNSIIALNNALLLLKSCYYYLLKCYISIFILNLFAFPKCTLMHKFYLMMTICKLITSV